jgi:heptosyltransferase I
LKILIVKTSAIGDVIHTLPVVDDLKRRYPTAQIDWVVEHGCFDFLLAHPGLTRVLLADMKRWRKCPFEIATLREIAAFLRELREVDYDLLFDFQGNVKSALITLSARAKKKVGFGWKSLPEKLNYFATNERHNILRHIPIRSKYLGLVRAFFSDADTHDVLTSPFQLQEAEQMLLERLISHPLMSQGPRLMISFGAHWRNKRLADDVLVNFLKVVHARYGARFFFPFGNKDEEVLAKTLKNLFPEHSLVIGKLSLQVWRALMVHMDGVVAMDSAALHLCGTTMTPSFSFFGPTSSLMYKPEGEQHMAFQGICPYGRTFEKRCPVLRTCASGACLREAPLSELLAQFDIWMKEV